MGMTDIFTAERAAQEALEVLGSSSSYKKRLMVIKILGRYDFGGQCIIDALFVGLQDSDGRVRAEVYRALSRMHLDRWELPEVARQIRHALALEKEGSPSWWSGMKALDKIRDFYEENYMGQDENCCHWQIVNPPF
jgi:hypothetical protein